MGTNFVLWDFDGTLASREGHWAACLIEAIRECDPQLVVALDDAMGRLDQGFPWHAPEVPHPHLNDPSAWWQVIERVLAAASVSFGVPARLAIHCAEQTRLRYLDCSGFKLFDDVVPTLRFLQEAGWKHLIVSNHVPELAELVDGLAISAYFEDVLTSALTGYEKPHPEAFSIARKACGPGYSAIWMVGDNIAADVRGAEAAGIPAILVRTETEESVRKASNLYEVAEHLEGSNLLDIAPTGRR